MKLKLCDVCRVVLESLSVNVFRIVLNGSTHVLEGLGLMFIHFMFWRRDMNIEKYYEIIYRKFMSGEIDERRYVKMSDKVLEWNMRWLEHIEGRENE